MLGLNSRGIRPGGDFAVTGFDDISEASVAVPPCRSAAATAGRTGRAATAHRRAGAAAHPRPAGQAPAAAAAAGRTGRRQRCPDLQLARTAAR
ncbi:hypothetical protein G6F61_013855 [Rhizopus arrhizus]|nr:hypothetical protein G6F61_013855 [Rhizopus arrhizus]